MPVRFDFEPVADTAITPEQIAPKMAILVSEIQGAFDLQGDGTPGNISIGTLDDLAKDRKIEKFYTWLPKFLAPGVLENPEDQRTMVNLAIWLSSLGHAPRRMGAGGGATAEEQAALLDALQAQRQAMGEQEAILQGFPGAERTPYSSALMQTAETSRALQELYTFRPRDLTAPEQLGPHTVQAFIDHKVANFAAWGNTGAPMETTHMYMALNAEDAMDDVQRAIIKGAMTLPHIGENIKKAASLEAAFGQLGLPTPEIFSELSRWTVPLQVKHGADVLSLGRIGPIDMVMLFENDPKIREKLMSNNYRRKWDAEGVAFSRVWNKCLLNFPVIDWKNLPAQGQSGYVTDTNLFRELTDDSGVLQRKVIDNLGTFGRWTVGMYSMGRAMVEGFGRTIYYDPVYAGAVPYDLRAGVGAGRYPEMYHIGLLQARSFNMYYGDLWSENWKKLIPVFGMQDKSAVEEDPRWNLATDVLNIEAGGNAEINARRKETLEWIYMDKPLRPHFKPYEDAMIYGEKCVIDTRFCPLNGFSEDEIRKYGLAAHVTDREKGLIEIDFDDINTARHFIRRNSSAKGWIRGAAEIKEIWDGLTPTEKADFDGVDWRPALKVMGISYQDVDQTSYKGATGLDRIITGHDVGKFMYENLAESDLRKWYYYAQNTKPNLTLMQVVQNAASFYPKLKLGNEESYADEGSLGRAISQSHEISRALKELAGITGKGFAFASGVEKGEVVSDMLIMMINNSTKHNTPHRKFDRKKNEKGDEWSNIELTESNMNTELSRIGKPARFAEIQKRLGYRIANVGSKHYIVGPGCHIVSASIEQKIDSFPAYEQFGARPGFIKLWVQAAYEGPVDSWVKDFFEVEAYLKLIEKAVDQYPEYTAREKKLISEKGGVW